MFVFNDGSQKHFHTNKNTNGWHLCGLFYIVRKNATSRNEGTFTLPSSVEDVPIIFKCNGMQSFGKAMVDLYKGPLII